LASLKLKFVAEYIKRKLLFAIEDAQASRKDKIAAIEFAKASIGFAKARRSTQ
jgi:hypothetical protein